MKALPPQDDTPSPSTPPLTDAERERLIQGDRNLNPPGLGLLALLREDLATHQNLFAQGFWALLVNRLGNWRMGLPRLFRPPFSLLYKVLFRLVHWAARIEMPYTVKVGRRVRIWHHGGCVLGAISIGDDVQIRHNVTFGLAHHGAPPHRIPVIEDRVLVGCGAVIVGPITIGHDSVVAANAVVTEDVPAHTLVGGIPARPLKQLEATRRMTLVKTKV